MRAWAMLAAALALGGCSREGDPSAQPSANDAADQQAELPLVSQAPSAEIQPNGQLRAGVSSLRGVVSGLNTRVTDMGLVIDLPSDALFDFDKADLTPSAARELAKAAELIRQSPPGAIEIIGHTDSLGDATYNQSLSEARAQAVARWFGQQMGVRQRAFNVFGKGEAEPIAPNERPDGSDDAAGRSKNRRVEVVVPQTKG